MVSPPTRSPSRLVARSRRRRAVTQQVLGDLGGGRDHVLAVVEHEQHLPVTDHLGEPARVRQRRGRPRWRRERRRDRRRAPAPRGSRRTSGRRPRPAPTSSARRVLPTPPGPTSVTKRCSANRSRELAELRVAADERRQRFRDACVAVLARRPARESARRRRSSEGSWARIAASNRRSSWPRFESELLAQDVTTLLEDAQRVGLPAGAVQREHQRAREAVRAADARRRAPRAATTAAW